MKIGIFRWALSAVAISISLNLFAQTAVTTTGGTVNTLPAFTGTATLGSSPVFLSGGNIGIGTSSPQALFSVGAGSPFQVTSTGALNTTSFIEVVNYAGNTARADAYK